MPAKRITKLLDDDLHVPVAAIPCCKVSSSLEERLYATTDANHNVTSIDDVFGAVKERFVYDPYRNSTVLTSAFATTSDAYGFIVRSQGQREDATTNTIDSRNRVYGLGIGRWMQADNIGGYVDGANRYQFVSSNPIQFTDPIGLWLITREPRNRRAIAFAAPGDKWTDLADQIHLNVEERTKWAKVMDIDQSGQVYDTQRSLPTKPDNTVSTTNSGKAVCAIYSIPNTIYYSIGQDWDVDPHHDDQQKIESQNAFYILAEQACLQQATSFVKEGYHIERQDDPRKALNNADVAMWEFSGHGDSPRSDGHIVTFFRMKNKQDALPEELLPFLNHKLARVDMMACLTDKANWSLLVSRLGQALTYPEMDDDKPLPTPTIKELFPNPVDGRDNLSGFSFSVDEHDAVDQFL